MFAVGRNLTGADSPFDWLISMNGFGLDIPSSGRPESRLPRPDSEVIASDGLEI